MGYPSSAVLEEVAVWRHQDDSAHHPAHLGCIQLTVKAVATAISVAETDSRTVDGRDCKTVDLVVVGIAAAEEARGPVPDRVLVEVLRGPEAYIEDVE